MKKIKALLSGVAVETFDHIAQVSYYNSNYYAFHGYLIYGHSDDDNSTDWYLVAGESPSIYLGYSYSSDTEESIIFEESI